jgi:hypothetical protein
MRVGIHQPNYLPWLGFFRKITQSDIFIFLDTVQFSKNSYQNRVQVKARDQGLWLTQPVQRQGGLKRVTRDVEFASTNWREKHLATLRQLYSKAPHYAAFIDIVSELLLTPSENLSEYNSRLIEGIAGLFPASPRFVRASDLEVEVDDPSHRLVRLIQKVGGSHYICGAGGRGYLDETLFAESAIEITYCTSDIPKYPQLNGDFVPGLSIVDYLFNCGVELELDC